MKVVLLAHTQPAPSLPVTSPVFRGASTFQENLVEYAGRICDRSDQRMGHVPTFIQARVR